MIDIQSLQERAARGQPAGETVMVGGWWLRYAPGGAWWLSTVLPHGEAAQPGEAATLDESLRAAERFYRDRGAPAAFQVTPGVCPEALDAMLAERGYRYDRLVSLQTATTAEAAADSPATLTDHPTAEWLECWAATHPGGDPRTQQQRLERLRSPTGYAAVEDSTGEVRAIGRAVVESGWAGIFSMATRPAARRQGAGRAVLRRLAAWAQAQHAANLYLQVASANNEARRLYERVGFTELCTYHYRLSTVEPARR